MADRKKDAPPVKLSSVVNAARYVPSTSQSSLIVGVRVRPLLKTEQVKAQRKDILRVMDSRVVVVLDPDDVVGNAKASVYTHATQTAAHYIRATYSFS